MKRGGRRWLGIALCVAAVMVLGSCLPAPASTPASPVSTGSTRDGPAGTQWRLTSLDGTPPLAGAPITLEFAGGKLTGGAGCNSYGAPYTLGSSATQESGSINIGGMDSTAIGCQTPPGVLEQETAYLAALRKVATFKMEGDQLRLAGPGGEAALVFRKK